MEPLPVMGQELEVEITDIAFGGEGVARTQDFVLFVPFVMVGEKVRVEITEVKKRFGRARCREMLVPSPERVRPQCRYYGECGGCQYQHLSYPAQLRLKHKQIADLLQRLGGFAPELVAPVVPCPQPYGYRNRIMIRSQWDKFKQGLNLGFLRENSGLVVDVEECAIAMPVLNEQLRHARAHPPPKGGLKVVLRAYPEGWEVPRDAFFQNNFFLLPELIRIVGRNIQASGSRHLVDAYCGVGFFSLELAGQVDSFAGVEYDRTAVRAARLNQQRRGVVNGEYWEGKTEEMLGGLLQRFPAAQTTYLLDPPRTGCRPEGLRQLRAAGPAQVIYVSCHPATLARDLNLLCGQGVYELAALTPLDMFPQTQHVECVADLRFRHPPPPGEPEPAETGKIALPRAGS
jgi:tRNA/tmRNA/rRNA uracil-C5-methylase (TrmA/RlmC/RlmD family)